MPVLGHCLGGQLMSKAFGGAVSANPVKEIGWGEVRVADNARGARVARRTAVVRVVPLARRDLQHPARRDARAARTSTARTRRFALGKHLGMQCHVEMTEELVRSWIAGGADEIRASAASPGVQQPAQIEKDLKPRLDACTRWRTGFTTAGRKD